MVHRAVPSLGVSRAGSPGPKTKTSSVSGAGTERRRREGETLLAGTVAGQSRTKQSEGHGRVTEGAYADVELAACAKAVGWHVTDPGVLCEPWGEQPGLGSRRAPPPGRAGLQASRNQKRC